MHGAARTLQHSHKGQPCPCMNKLHVPECIRVPHPGGYRVLELTAGLVVISIACTPDLRDWGTLLGPLGTLMSKLRSLASAEVWDTLPQLLYCTVLYPLPPPPPHPPPPTPPSVPYLWSHVPGCSLQPQISAGQLRWVKEHSKTKVCNGTDGARCVWVHTKNEPEE
jgi:hypothetical protein